MSGYLIEAPGSDPEVVAVPSPGQVTWTVKQILERPDPPACILITDCNSDPQAVAAAVSDLAMSAFAAAGSPLPPVAPPF